jgi:2'-hydroxyisoflavone reductase
LDSFSAHETITAQSPILSWTEADETDTSMLTYGQRKAACEAVVQSFPEFNPVIFRPGLIYGPYDPTDRAYYWLWRQNQRKNLLVPDTLGLRSQMTFALDFARVLETALFLNRIPEAVYLALTHSPLSLAEIFESMRASDVSAPQLSPVSGDWLEKQDIRYWMDLPLTLPFERRFENAQLQRDFAGAFTPFAQSMAICRDYYARLGWPIPQTGLSPEREDAFLDTLKS